jgi:hypothetical protein
MAQEYTGPALEVPGSTPLPGHFGNWISGERRLPTAADANPSGKVVTPTAIRRWDEVLPDEFWRPFSADDRRPVLDCRAPASGPAVRVFKTISRTIDVHGCHWLDAVADDGTAWHRSDATEHQWVPFAGLPQPDQEGE